MASIAIGETIQTVGGFKAYDLDDALIGTFPTHEAAIVALPNRPHSAREARTRVGIGLTPAASYPTLDPRFPPLTN